MAEKKRKHFERFGFDWKERDEHLKKLEKELMGEAGK